MRTAKPKERSFAAIRKYLGLSLEQVAYRTGYSPQHVRRCELASRKLTLVYARKLAHCYGVTVDDLFHADRAVGAIQRRGEAASRIAASPGASR